MNYFTEKSDMEEVEIKQVTPKWEYKVEIPEIISIEEENDYLNKMGGEGWELFSIKEFTGSIWYYFKRVISTQY